jgi:hypothetical protein
MFGLMCEKRSSLVRICLRMSKNMREMKILKKIIIDINIYTLKYLCNPNPTPTNATILGGIFVSPIDSTYFMISSAHPT